MAGKELATRPKVDPADEPSAEWGWHGEFPRATLIAAVVTAIILPLLLIGHAVSWTEIIWMTLPSVVILVMVAIGLNRRRHSWRR